MRTAASRALVAGVLLCFVLATGANAQVGAPALADPGLQIDLPPPVETGIEQQPGTVLRRSHTLSPVSPSSPIKTVLSLSALFSEGSSVIGSGLRWRIFSDQPDYNGAHALVAETTDARPLVTLDPGGYIVHVSYGLASATRHVVLGTEAESQQIALNCGALRFSGNVGGAPIPAAELRFEIHRSDGTMEELVSEVKAGELVRLRAGAYQVTSTYGLANAKIISEVRVEPGKLTEAAVLHKAGRADIKLIGPDGREVPDATWSILTPGGDIISETLPTLKDVVLAEGEYIAVARHDGRIFQQPFEVHSGEVAKVEVAGR